MTDSPAPRKRRTVFVTAGLSASAAVIAASLVGAQTQSEGADQRAGLTEQQPEIDDEG